LTGLESSLMVEGMGGDVNVREVKNAGVREARHVLSGS